MKRFLTLLLSVVLVLTLAACGGSPAAQPSEAHKAEAPATQAEVADSAAEPTEAPMEVTVPPSEPVPDALNPYNKPYDPNGLYFGPMELVHDNVVRFQLYTPDMYPADAVQALKVGDKIAVEGKAVEITSIYVDEYCYTLNEQSGSYLSLVQEMIPDFDNATEDGMVPSIPGDYYLITVEKTVGTKLHTIECELTADVYVWLNKGFNEETQVQEYEDLTGLDLLEMLKTTPEMFIPDRSEFLLKDGKVRSISLSVFNQ